MERATDTSATLLLLLWHCLVSSLTLRHDSAFLLQAVFTFDGKYRASVVAIQTMNLFFFILLFFLGRGGGIVSKGSSYRDVRRV
jgi:hypothetical protein